MSVARQSLIGSLWMALETAGRQGSTFLVFAILAWLLDPETYGLLAMAMAAPLIAQTIVVRGLSEAVVQRTELTPLAVSSAFWANLTLGAAITLALVALAYPLSLLLQEPRLPPLIAAMSLSVLLASIAAIPAAVLRRDMQFNLFAIRSLAGNIVGGVLGVSMALMEAGVWSLVGYQLGKGVTDPVILFFGGRWRPSREFSWAAVRDLVGFARNSAATGFVIMVSDELPKIISGVLLGPVATGVYFLARRLFDFLTEVLLAPLFSVAFSSFSRLQDNPAEMQRLFNGYIRFALLLAAPAFIGFAIVAPILLPLVFGEKWKTVVIPAQIMMALGIERAMVPITAGVLAAIGRTSVLLILGLSYACLLALFAVAGARFGVPGIASGLVLCNFLSMFLVIGLAQRLSPIDTVSGLVRNWPVIIATILMFLATETAFQFTQAWPPIVQVGALVSIGAASFLASMWIFGRSLLRDVVDVALSLRRRPPAPASPP